MKNNELLVEPTLRVGANLLKPDLIVKNEEQILVVDVTVRYENKDYLLKAEKEKVCKYFPCQNYFKEKYNIDDGEILPVVLGSREAITPNTEGNLKCMRITDKEINTITQSRCLTYF